MSQERAYTPDFSHVHAAEIAWINQGKPLGERLVAPHTSQRGREAAAIMPGATPVQGRGIALSGGGIRSAAFALGALQAMDQDLGDTASGTGGIGRFEYLSTVSGGGYIGTSLRIGMEKLGGRFPFSSQAGDKQDNPAVGHIRNYSRYLIPNGLPDAIGSVVVILRGLVVNVAMVLAALLVFAGMTGIFNPNQQAFRTPDLFGWEGFAPATALGEFGYTKLLLLLGAGLLLAWGLVKSLSPRGTDEFRGAWYRIACLWLCVLAFSALLELQPFAVRGLFEAYGGLNQATPGRPDSNLGLFATVVSGLSPYFAPLAAVFAFVSRYFGDALRTASSDSGLKSVLSVILAKAALVFLALALPLLIWVAYLHLTLVTDIGFLYRWEWLAVLVSGLCRAPDIGLVARGETLASWPGWVQHAVYGNAGPGPLASACTQPYLVGELFVAAGALIFLLTWFYRPNANSLHRLYRDRLSKAFLFDPTKADDGKPGSDPTELGSLPLDSDSPRNGLLHLINCALNVQGSKFVNRRGRNADFFFFSPVYSGSSATGFVSSGSRRARLPDIGSAMAISGAAVSSNMGANTVWGMAPTLALLNIRLGYWLRNPKHLAPGDDFRRSAWEKLRDALKLYLVSEMFSQLDERATEVYLTDGGHIENLGLYELLRRRVGTIVVIDAEADPAMTFTAFVTAQRFARIDLGVRIDLPWQAIREATLAVDKAVAAGATIDPVQARSRPHIAVGTIDYGDAEGRIIYVKSSMTGDENDYVLAYKRRYPSFPHETTGDQFFSEEQFEAYRALGFHALHSAFMGKTHVEGLALLAPPTTTILPLPDQADRMTTMSRKTTAPDPGIAPAPPAEQDEQARGAAFRGLFQR